MARKKAKPTAEVTAPLFTAVTTRLYTEDVEELKRQAVAAGETGWQPRLRLLVHRALHAAKKVLR